MYYIEKPHKNKSIRKKRGNNVKFIFCLIICMLLIYCLIKYFTADTIQIPEDTDYISENSINNEVTVEPATPVEPQIIQSNIPLTDEQYEKITHIYSSSNEKTVYLTFDDGPSKTVTPLILDLLKSEHVPATFFVLGSNAEYYPNIVKRAYSEGHFIANHGYSHKYAEIYATPEAVLNDYLKCEEALKKAVDDENFKSKVFRFPGGSSGGKYAQVKSDAIQLLKENHIAYLDWNSLTCDAEGTPTHESILQNLKTTVGNKNVVVLLMHDSSSKILTYETLDEVISFFKENGYTFKSLNDML